MPDSSEKNNDVVPSVYVDESVLRPTLCTPTVHKAYRINNQDFIDTHHGVQEFAEFKVYAETPPPHKEKMEEVDAYCSTPTDSGSECGDVNTAGLNLTLQTVANGYIINSSCYLSWQHWHTLVSPSISDRLLHCIVCSAYIETNSGEAHVTTDNHCAALQAFPPLEKLDLSITRKIRNQYHCGVCNEVFDLKNGDNHFSGKMHEGNILFSINRASDLLDNYGYPIDTKPDIYHFKTHQMSDTASVGSDCANDNLNYINWQNNYQYEEYEDDFEAPVFTGLSYATMAKKPKAVTQNFLEIDLGNKKVKVRFDSWHMVISPKPNRFWCMVCKKFDLIRNKQDHCRETQHLNNLDRCRLVEAYQDYFIRQVDGKLYHCGHCNNLQLIHEMEDHIQSNHPRKTQAKIMEARPASSPIKNNENNKNNINTAVQKNYNSPIKIKVKSAQNSVDSNSIHKPTMPMKSENNGSVPVPIKSDANGICQKMPDISQNTVIFVFGYKVTIPSLSYNIVCQRPNDFYCGLCDVICKEQAISSHVFDVRHLELLQRTPFIAPYNCNLIRAIRDMLHCAICNMPVTAAEIYNHIQDLHHVEFLSKALNQNRLPPIGVKIPNVPETPNVVASTVQATPDVATSVGSNVAFKAMNIGTTVAKTLTFEATKVRTPPNSPCVPTTANIVPPNSPCAATTANIGASPNICKVPSTFINTTPFKQENTRVKNVEITKTKAESESNDEEFEEDCKFDEEEIENDKTFDSVASEDATFDVEEYVYLKLKNTYIKISNTSYNTVVHIGDGSRYCFVCSNRVQSFELQKHVDSRSHLENMEKYRFLDKYEDHLLRQIYLMYHCAICNVIITRKELKVHLEWPTHALQNENTLKNIKKTRKNDIKGGIKQIIVSTQKENIYLHEKEPIIKITFNANVVQSLDEDSNGTTEFSRKNKIIIFNDNVLKFPWEHWQGITKNKNGYKCNLCQRDLKCDDIDVHCNSEWHKYSLDKPFEKQYAPALVRKINDSTLNCVICNTEVSNKSPLVAEHINGKRHARAHDAILKDSSQARTYTDCHNDVLML